MSHPSITQQDKMFEKFMKNSTDDVFMTGEQIASISS